MSPRHFYNLADETPATVGALLRAAERFRAEPVSDTLSGLQLALLFLAPSLRTRCSFEVGIRQLGGAVTTLEGAMFYGLETRDGVRMDGDRPEHVREAVPVLSRFYAGLGLRVMAEGNDREADLGDVRFRQFMAHATVPVFNMESALYHPCQALADLLTIQRRLGGIAGRKLTVTWAPHPRPLPTAVPNSILLAATQMGMHVTLARPEGFDLPEPVLARAEQLAREAGGSLTLSSNQAEAVAGAQAVYAKSWGGLARYADPDGEQAAREALGEWTVDERLMEGTDGACFMHCLPVRRNVVVTDAVLDGPRSVVVDQAENRLHAQKAVLAWLYRA